MKFPRAILLSSTIIALSACSSQQAVPTKAQMMNSMPVQGSAIGCFAGALIYTDSKKRNLTFLKCFIGGAAGYLIGKSISQRKASYANAEQRLNGEISHTKVLNMSLQRHLMTQNAEIAKHEMKIKAMLSTEASTKANLLSLAKTYKELSKVEADEKRAFAKLEKELEFKEETVQTLSVSQMQQREKLLQQEVNLLKKNIAKLSKNRAKLTSYKQRVSNVLL